jgi:hypothetical protein
VPIEKYNDSKGGDTMKTAEEIIAYLEAELNEAIETHDASKDKAQRFAMMLKAYTISELLDEIKG